jgi:hypothetical protein
MQLPLVLVGTVISSSIIITEATNIANIRIIAIINTATVALAFTDGDDIS